jgi:tetratricopeptide (TPR) repeat protein
VTGYIHRWVYRPGRWVSLLWLILPAAGCAELGPAEKRMLREADELYRSSDIPGAKARCDRLIQNFPDAAEIAEAHYIRGLCHAHSRQANAAAKDFEAAARKSRREDLTALSRASLGSLAYHAGEWERAHRNFSEALPNLPATPPKDELLYTAGLAAQRAGAWDDAARWFREVMHQFGNRPVAADARRMAQWRHPYFAIQLGVFRDSTNAAALVRRLRDQRIDAVQENMPRGGEATWVVMAGRYRTYAEARRGLESIRQAQSGAFIIP